MNGAAMKLNSDDFRVRPGTKVHLAEWPTAVTPVYKSKKKYEKILAGTRGGAERRCSELHYASNRYAVLLIFQAMDAAGKDGAIRHVMSGVNPQGCQVFSFKHPSARSWSTTSCGAPRAPCPSAAASASSTAPTTRRC